MEKMLRGKDIKMLRLQNQNFDSLTSNVYHLASEVEKVYPNPSNSDVTIEFEKAKQVNAQLYDATGRLVRSFETSEEQTTYIIRGLSHGIYNLRLIDQNGEAENKRIIIR